MRRDLFEQYQRLSFGYYDRHNTGVMMSKITTDLFDISELAHHGPENLFICTLKIVGSFVLLFMINGPLTAIMLVVTIVMAALSFALNYWRRRIFRENRERMAGINAAVQDSLGRHPRREVLRAARTPSARSSARPTRHFSTRRTDPTSSWAPSMG